MADQSLSTAFRQDPNLPLGYAWASDLLASKSEEASDIDQATTTTTDNHDESLSYLLSSTNSNEPNWTEDTDPYFAKLIQHDLVQQSPKTIQAQFEVESDRRANMETDIKVSAKSQVKVACKAVITAAEEQRAAYRARQISKEQQQRCTEFLRWKAEERRQQEAYLIRQRERERIAAVEEARWDLEIRGLQWQQRGQQWMARRQQQQQDEDQNQLGRRGYSAQQIGTAVCEQGFDMPLNLGHHQNSGLAPQEGASQAYCQSPNQSVSSMTTRQDVGCEDENMDSPTQQCQRQYVADPPLQYLDSQQPRPSWLAEDGYFGPELW